MCDEWLYWKSKTEKAETREQSTGATERAWPVNQPIQLAPTSKKPEQIETELETV